MELAPIPPGGLSVLSFDADGTLVDPDGVLDTALAALIDDPPVTDVIVICHGWFHDMARAVRAYQGWVQVMRHGYAVRRSEVLRRRPGFRALAIGLHWPSAPWEDRRALRSVEEEVASYAAVIGDRTAADDLRPLVTDALAAPQTTTLSPANRARLLDLDRKADLRTDQVGARPGDDRRDFDPDRIVADFTRSGWRALGRSGPLHAILAPLWVSSFWKMKKRALDIGSTGVYRLLARLRASGADVRLHLVGHSFGSIVCTAAVRGPECTAPAAGAVHSLTLLQGALSLWSFAPSVPDTDRNGFFHDVLAHNLVTGPIVATQSRHDTALRWYYRMAATVQRTPWLEGPRSLPKYGAVGTYGLAGLSEPPVTLTGETGQLLYPIEPGRCHNVECSAFIEPAHGVFRDAHSNLIRAELAGLVWDTLTA